MESAADRNDTAALNAAGKKAVLKREWNFWAVLGFSATTLATWEATSALFASAYFNGGPASVVYGFIVSVMGTVFIAISMAEMASISPIAGAQYHWTAEHAPTKYKSFLSYCQGWLTILGWLAGLTSVAFLLATMIQSVALFNNPDYVPQRWQATLIMIAFGGVATLGNTFGKRFLPFFETLAGALHVILFFVVFIALLATSKKASAKDVWGTFINQGGWSSNGVSFCLGFLTPAFALAGVDAVVHMSEETHNAPMNIPRAMIGAVIINGVAGFAYIVTILYCITDSTTVLAAPFPILVVFQEATGSQKASTAILSGIITIFSFALFGVFASTSRLIWAFSRDKGLPASGFFARITEWNKTPTNAVLLCFVVTSLLSLINIGSTAAFNAFLSLATIGFYFSYALPICLFLLRRFDHNNPIAFGPWRVSRMMGIVSNVLALMFCTFLIIFLPFPSFLPVTAQNMNYAAPIFIGVMGFAIIFYFVHGHKHYVGPIKETTGSEASSQTEDITHQTEVMDEKDSHSTLKPNVESE